ncbi:hypothetical protein BrevBR_15375 [Brevundimonas sp. BR2-1]|uniref:DUF6624 domain-containing protein n=1 Tax=Brevundimonas sp. BR2-1 TaxID=3031123 RepID=UPI0030AF2245
MRFFLILAALASMGSAPPQTPPPGAAASVQASPPALSEPAAAMVAGVRSAIDQELARQAEQPAPQTDADRLVNMAAVDRVGRNALARSPFQTLPEAERRPARSAAYAYIKDQDQRAQAAMAAMQPEGGWWTRDRYGDEAANAALLLVQHADETAWRQYLPQLKVLAARGEAPGAAVALMEDRLALTDGRPQVYGTQAVCRDHRFVVYDIEDAVRAERLRSQAGMPSLASYTAEVATYPAC